jgi:hypothetical protein
MSYGISDDLGNVSFFGLDDFGQPVGLGAGWGALIGGGVSTAAAIGVRTFGKSGGWYKWSEGIGALAGILAGGTMMFFKKTTYSGVAAIGTALATGGLRQLEVLFGPSQGQMQYLAEKYGSDLDKAQALLVDKNGKPLGTRYQDAAATIEDKGGAYMYKSGGPNGEIVQVPPALGMINMERVPTLGMVSMEPTRALGSGMPKILSGNPEQHRRASATLLGVPGLNSPFSQIASAWGTTALQPGR